MLLSFPTLTQAVNQLILSMSVLFNFFVAVKFLAQVRVGRQSSVHR